MSHRLINSIRVLFNIAVSTLRTWPARTRNYWRLDNADHISAITKTQRNADLRWERYARSDEGRQRLRKD